MSWYKNSNSMVECDIRLLYNSVMEIRGLIDLSHGVNQTFWLENLKLRFFYL